MSHEQELRNLRAKVQFANIVLTNRFKACGYIDTLDISHVYTDMMREQGVTLDLTPIWDDQRDETKLIEFLKIRDVA